jgi:hypothetical protein
MPSLPPRSIHLSPRFARRRRLPARSVLIRSSECVGEDQAPTDFLDVDPSFEPIADARVTRKVSGYIDRGQFQKGDCRMLLPHSPAQYRQASQESRRERHPARCSAFERPEHRLRTPVQSGDNKTGRACREMDLSEKGAQILRVSETDRDPSRRYRWIEAVRAIAASASWIT